MYISRPENNRVVTNINFIILSFKLICLFESGSLRRCFYASSLQKGCAYDYVWFMTVENPHRLGCEFDKKVKTPYFHHCKNSVRCLAYTNGR